MPDWNGRRKNARYALAFPLKLVQYDADPMVTQSENISSKGIYFLVPQEYKAGSELELFLTLPSPSQGDQVAWIRCQATLVRVDPPNEKGQIGIAAEIRKYNFLTETDSLPSLAVVSGT